VVSMGTRTRLHAPGLFHVDLNLIRDQKQILTPMPPQPQSGSFGHETSTYTVVNVFSLPGHWSGLWIAVTLHRDNGTELTPLTQLIWTSYPWASRSSMVALADRRPLRATPARRPRRAHWQGVPRRQEAPHRAFPS
jgi:hypothetical protein